MEMHMGKAAKNPSFKNVKAALKEPLMVAKVFLKFLWKVITTKRIRTLVWSSVWWLFLLV